MIYTLFDLDHEDDDRHRANVTYEINSMFDGQCCTVCDKPFATREEKDEAYISGLHPLTYAHEQCYEEQVTA